MSASDPQDYPCTHLVPVFGCSGCIVKRDAPELAGSIPEWFTPTKTNRTQTGRVARGLHPMGLRLLEGDAGAKCGNCKHARRVRYAGTYIKCSKSAMTGGPATDIRLKWPACTAWEGEDS